QRGAMQGSGERSGEADATDPLQGGAHLLVLSSSGQCSLLQIAKPRKRAQGAGAGRQTRDDSSVQRPFRSRSLPVAMTGWPATGVLQQRREPSPPQARLSSRSLVSVPPIAIQRRCWPWQQRAPISQPSSSSGPSASGPRTCTVLFARLPARATTSLQTA